MGIYVSRWWGKDSALDPVTRIAAGRQSCGDDSEGYSPAQVSTSYRIREMIYVILLNQTASKEPFFLKFVGNELLKLMYLRILLTYMYIK